MAADLALQSLHQQVPICNYANSASSASPYAVSAVLVACCVVSKMEQGPKWYGVKGARDLVCGPGGDRNTIAYFTCAGKAAEPYFRASIVAVWQFLRPGNVLGNQNIGLDNARMLLQTLNLRNFASLRRPE